MAVLTSNNKKPQDSNTAMIDEYFSTPVWRFEKPEWVESAIKATDKHIEWAKDNTIKDLEERRSKGDIKNKKLHEEIGSFGLSYHSGPVAQDPELKEIMDWTGATAQNMLDWMGFDMTQYTIFNTETWVQEFSEKGGGHHNSHNHANNHISGFLYLKCGEFSSFPVLHDSRPGAIMSQLKQKDRDKITHASGQVWYRPQPGTLILAPAYVTHQYSVDPGKEEFRFIHFNFQAVDNNIITSIKDFM